jgi:methionine-rich copper-binding protein CopC
MLDHAEPPAESELRESPPELSLFFTQALKPASSWVLLRDADGNEIQPELAFDAANAKLMKAKLPELKPGVYTVRWQSLSADDDDYAQGSYKLTVLNPDGSRPQGSTESAAESNGGGGGWVLVVGAVVAGAVVLTGGLLILSQRRAKL